MLTSKERMERLDYINHRVYGLYLRSQDEPNLEIRMIKNDLSFIHILVLELMIEG